MRHSKGCDVSRPAMTNIEHRLDPFSHQQPGSIERHSAPESTSGFDQRNSLRRRSQTQDTLRWPKPCSRGPSQKDGPAGATRRSKKPRAERRRLKATAATGDTSPEAHLDSAANAGDERSAAFEVEIPTDELAALDAENRHLKTLLSKQLLQENTRLRKMLERFGVS